MHLITAENEFRPEVNVCAQIVDKGKDVQGRTKQSRLIAIYVTEKNVGKVPIELDENALKVTIKKIPETRSLGFISIDKQSVSYENKDYLKRYGKEGTVIDPGVEYTDVELVDLPPGAYHIEAMIDLHDGDFTNGIAIVDVNANESASSHCGAQVGKAQ